MDEITEQALNKIRIFYFKYTDDIVRAFSG